MKQIAVIGAGITGLLAAYYLARSGHSVTVYEQELYPAMKTSFANGGQVSVSNSEVWTTWANVRKGIKWMFKKDAPLLIRLSFEPKKLSWLGKFLWHTVKGDYASNTAKTIQLGLESRELYKQIIAEENLKFDQLDSGILHFYKNRDYFQHALDVEQLYKDNGCDWEILTANKLNSLDPALASISGVIGGAWTKTDWTGDIHKFCTQLASVLTIKYNVKFVYDCNLLNINELTYFENIVISNGVGAAKLAKSVGDNLPIYPVKGYSITIKVRPEDIKYMPKVSLLDDQAKIVTSTMGDRLRVAGTAELAGENYDIRRDRIEPLLNWVHTNFPGINTSDYTSWACLRPMTPNMMPIVKQSPSNPKVFYHGGHGHLGWTVSPATAQNLTRIINNE